jgi:hypothetical protein
MTRMKAQMHEQLALVSVSKLADAMHMDIYPEKEVEEVFGIDMMEGTTANALVERPLGTIIYGVYQEIYFRFGESVYDYGPGRSRVAAQLKDEVTHALQRGVLPEWYTRKTNEIIDDINESSTTGIHSTEMKRRGFGTLAVNPDSKPHADWTEDYR